ncbi:MAG: AbrB/MazE/SpoVT family DNA-binding domain-containing protein [Nitrososphaerota archaeon]|nr:AbrB/MazE/SpoVT family DNA-binding domain-containing protein [Nitrososphaerota archaeon]MDG6948851.1 AbrB/MazE/SpoVT family DNA-binding domain-containing protein [Nitrososphaerota archaeon]
MTGGEGLLELDFVKVQKKTHGSLMVTIPADAVKELGIKEKQRVKVYLDRKMKRVVFELAS